MVNLASTKSRPAEKGVLTLLFNYGFLVKACYASPFFANIILVAKLIHLHEINFTTYQKGNASISNFIVVTQSITLLW